MSCGMSPVSIFFKVLVRGRARSRGRGGSRGQPRCRIVAHARPTLLAQGLNAPVLLDRIAQLLILKDVVGLDLVHRNALDLEDLAHGAGEAALWDARGALHKEHNGLLFDRLYAFGVGEREKGQRTPRGGHVSIVGQRHAHFRTERRTPSIFDLTSFARPLVCGLHGLKTEAAAARGEADDERDDERDKSDRPRASDGWR